ncbi:hypothetical protein EB241_09585 [Erwinia psidii]|uniref:Uncharacterized protein n=1 Tax=Erwinia psidii TaxID=69224 RepID=A0A3N6V076_9GAMM|nr:hypothetical protein EB241_09585 [Erwinia psidii]
MPSAKKRKRHRCFTHDVKSPKTFRTLIIFAVKDLIDRFAYRGLLFPTSICWWVPLWLFLRWMIQAICLKSHIPYMELR